MAGNVTLVGSIGVGSAVTSGTAIPGTYGQTPTNGNLLVAVLEIGGSSAVAFSTSQTSGTTGWAKLVADRGDGAGGSGNSWGGLAIWWKAAAGGDAAPSFTYATSLSYGRCRIFELTGANNASPLDVSGYYVEGSYTSSGSESVSTPNVAGSGEYAICATYVSYASGSHTPISGYTNVGADSASPYYFAVDVNASPAGGASAGGTDSWGSGETWVIQLAVIAASAGVPQADEGGSTDLLAVQITSVPPAVLLAPPQPSGPPPPPLPARLLLAPAGSAFPQDAAAAAEAMSPATVTAALADTAGAAEAFFGGVNPLDQAAAVDDQAGQLAVSAAVALADTAAGADAQLPAPAVPLPDAGGAADKLASGLYLYEDAAAADALSVAVTGITYADTGAVADLIGAEPAVGASGGSTTPQAMPGTSEVAVAAPGSAEWIYLGSIGQMTALTYSFACPGGTDKMSCTLMVPASYRNQAFSPGWQVRIYRGGHQVWDGRMDEPVPTAQGWNFTAAGTGMRGSDFTAVYTDTWPSNEPDESINNAIARGLPWVNPGVGQPAGAWFGQAVDSGAQTITDLLNLVCTRGQMTWYVNSQPGGMAGDDLSVFPLPTTVTRLLVATTPVPRTLGGFVNTIWIRYEISADVTGSSGSDTPATYGLTSAQNAADIAIHQQAEAYIDLSDAGVMTAAQAQAVGNAVLAIYQRASFAGPFTARWGQLLNPGGAAVDPGTDQAGTVVRLILTDFGYGGEVVPSAPVTFIVGGYEWDDFAQVATITPYQALDQSLTGMLQMENTVLKPITVAST